MRFVAVYLGKVGVKDFRANARGTLGGRANLSTGYIREADVRG